MLRELRLSDAPSLLAQLHQSRVFQYTAPCPPTVEGFRRFIRWTQDERRRGRHACYGIIPPGETLPVGIIQVWPIERDFSTAECGFVLGESYWGTGLFMRSAQVFLQAVFGPLGVFRLKARSAEDHYRANGVLRKLGATREGELRGGFRDGEVISNHVMWSILAPEWVAATSRVQHELPRVM